MKKNSDSENEIDEEEKEFNNEINKRNKNNIIKIFQKFKIKKGVDL